MRIAVFKPSHRLAWLAWIIGAQLINPWFAGDALAMSMRRAPFHAAGILPTVWERPVWRTFAGSPGVQGTNDGPGIAARFSSPSSLVVDAAGMIYVADNSAIRRITPAGMVSTVAGRPGQSGWQDGPATSALFNGSRSLALDSSGNLYVADYCAIRKLSVAGLVTTIAGQPGVNGYQDGTGTNALFADWSGGLAVDTSGNLYVADSQNYVVRKVSPDGVVSTVAGQPRNSGYQDGTGTNALFGYLGGGLAFDSKGDLYVVDNTVIRKISPAGVVTTWVGQPGKSGYRDGKGTNAWFSGLSGLATDNQGNLYLTDSGWDDPCIRKVSADGEVSTLGGDAWANITHLDGVGPFARFSYPVAIALDPVGHFVVADSQTIRYGSVGTEPRPQILRQPRSQTAEAGTTVGMSVVAQCAVALTYQWLANGEPIIGATNASLVLSKVSEADAGEYRVAISDGVGFVLSSPASLQVQANPGSSPNPLDNWQRLAGPPLTEIHGLAHGNGRYVAIGGGYAPHPWPPQPEAQGSVATSPDGESWAKQFPITSECLNDVAFGNGEFVIVGNKGTVFTSTNGLAWEAQTLTPEGLPDLHGIAFDQGIFVAVSGDANGSIWTSTDGSNWTNRGIDYGVSFVAVAAHEGRFIAVGNTIMTSTNGVDWEPANLASISTNYVGQEILLEHIACGDGTILAAKHEGNGVLVSSDGLEWRDAAPTNGLSIARVTFGNGQFLAVDSNSGGVSVSTDGLNWSSPTLIRCGERSASRPHLRFEQGLFVATGEEGALFTSSDGKSWKLREQQQAVPFVPWSIIKVGERYLAGGSAGIATSSNGSDWSLLLPTKSFAGLAYGKGKLIAVGGDWGWWGGDEWLGGDEWIFTSDDGGATWMDRSPHLNYGTKCPSLSGITYGGGVFVASGDLSHLHYYVRGAHLLISSNGVAWTAVDFAETSSLSGVAYGAGLFVAPLNQSNGHNEILTSTNGLSWQTAATISSNQLNGLAYGNGRFVIGTANGTVITSPDGRTWSQHAVPDAAGVGIVFGNGLFLAMSGDALWSSSDGVNWTQCAAPPVSPIAAGDGVFFAVGEDAVLYQSGPIGPIERLGNPRWLSNTSLEWTVTGAPLINYRIEFSEDLLNWQTLEHVTNAPATRPFSDPAAATRTKRFYRVVTE